MCRVFDFVLLLTVLALVQSLVVNDFSALSFDENRRLTNHWVLHSNNPLCSSHVTRAWKEVGSPEDIQQIGAVDQAALSALFGTQDPTQSCQVVCLEKGTLDTQLTYALPERKFEVFYDQHQATVDFLQVNCRQAEVGFLSFLPHVVDIFWINFDGEKLLLNELEAGERYTFWTTSFFGHVFELYNHETGEYLETFRVTHAGFHVLGKAKSLVRAFDPTPIVRETIDNEWVRSRRVKHTFTELGFDKGQLPLDLYTSMSTYYYNNRHSKALEEWDTKGVFVNWWERDVFMIGMPWGLKVSAHY